MILCSSLRCIHSPVGGILLFCKHLERVEDERVVVCRFRNVADARALRNAFQHLRLSNTHRASSRIECVNEQIGESTKDDGKTMDNLTREVVNVSTARMCW